MTLTFAIIFFIFGLIIGSFLNVIIYRLNTRRSFFRSFGGRSACMSCQNRLSWYELIPLLSFLGLQGRCRNCKTKISIQYPLVELLTGLIFLSLFLKFQDIFFTSTFLFAVTYIYYTTTFSLLLVIAVYDLRHKIIPDSLVLTFCALCIFSINGAFFGGIFLAIPFAFLWLVSKGAWIGLGDAKLVLGLGWFLGLYQALSAIMLAFWSGSLVGLALLIFKKTSAGMKTEIPFAPFLIAGSFVSFIFNLRLLEIHF